MFQRTAATLARTSVPGNRQKQRPHQPLSVDWRSIAGLMTKLVPGTEVQSGTSVLPLLLRAAVCWSTAYSGVASILLVSRHRCLSVFALALVLRRRSTSFENRPRCWFGGIYVHTNKQKTVECGQTTKNTRKLQRRVDASTKHKRKPPMTNKRTAVPVQGARQDSQQYHNSAFSNKPAATAVSAACGNQHQATWLSHTTAVLRVTSRENSRQT